MKLSRQTFLLFVLNLLDAVLTIYWIHNGYATEGNQLMAGLLDIGYTPFLIVKMTIGALAALVLWRWGNLRIARYGLTVVLFLYISLMGVHFVTGLSAFGFISERTVREFSTWTQAASTFFA